MNLFNRNRNKMVIDEEKDMFMYYREDKNGYQYNVGFGKGVFKEDKELVAALLYGLSNIIKTICKMTGFNFCAVLEALKKINQNDPACKEFSMNDLYPSCEFLQMFNYPSNGEDRIVAVGIPNPISEDKVIKIPLKEEKDEKEKVE